MVLLDSSVLIFNYVCASVFGVGCLLFLATSWYYGMKGLERTFKAAKFGTLLVGFFFVIALIDAGDTTFTYTRPSDSVVIYWGRYIFSVWIFPFAAAIYFQLLHDPSTKISKENGVATIRKLDRDDSSNKRHVFHDMMWLTILTFLLSSIFLFLSVMSDNSSVRWASFSVGILLSVISVFFILYYVNEYGFRTLRGKSDSYYVDISRGFWGRKGFYMEEWAMFVLFFLLWLCVVIALILGPGLTSTISYTFEAMMYLIAYVIYVFYVWRTIYLVRKTHVKVELMLPLAGFE